MYMFFVLQIVPASFVREHGKKFTQNVLLGYGKA